MMRKLFLSAFCCLALQGVMAQVDGMMGASVQTKDTSCGASSSATCCKKTHTTPASQLLGRLKKLQKRGIMLTLYMELHGSGMKARVMCCLLQVIILL